MSQASRSGNAIVVALGVFTIAAVMVVTAVDGATSTAKMLGAELGHTRALAALDVVLSRREMDIVERAGQGDMAEIARWNQNYGVDFIGGVEVRWKIEPWRTQPTDAAGEDVHHITNPNPDTSWTTPATAPKDDNNSPYWQPNDNNFMFRVSAQAQEGIDPNVDPDSPSQLSASGKKVVAPAHIVQGTRYTSVLKEPLFRYVIFYAARGTKGDLELSHAGNLDIQGSVHTNGSLYIGSGLRTNDKIARLGALNSSLAPSYTKIGPDVDGKDVRVNGVDGIFRISKPLMFTIMNGFPVVDNSVSASHGDPDLIGGATTTWAASDSYDLLTPFGGTPVALDPSGGDLTSIANATNTGRRINPYRIKDGSGAITENTFGNADNLRTINGVAIRGVNFNGATTGADSANDGRYLQRGPGRTWPEVSMGSAAPGFNGKARSIETGQNIKSLPERMRNRAFEPQRLEYADNDGDDATDEHEFARPLFVKADGTVTTDFPRSTLPGFPTFDSNAVVEAPGRYLSYAMGGDGQFMVRRDDGTGWYIRNRDGVQPGSPSSGGLIIRERPVPSVDHWPGNTPPWTQVTAADPRWLPYAYGKHWYPSTFRFSVADVVEVCAPTSADPWSYSGWQDNPLHASRINTTPQARVVSYAPGGRLSMTTAQNAAGVGNNFYHGWTDGSYGNYRRKPYFYAQNWRFVHLGQHQIDTSRNGLRVTVFNDRPSGSGSQSLVGGIAAPNADIIPVTTPADGIIAVPRVTNTADGIQTATSAPTSLVGSRRSVRFEGFLTASATNLYGFTAATGGSQAARVWVDGVLVYTNWGVTESRQVRLIQDRAVPFQVDYYIDNNTVPSLTVSWQTIEPALSTWSTIPATAFNPPVRNPGIDRTAFERITVRIDKPFAITGPAQQKVGLMVRDGSGGMSPVLNGAAPYAFIGFSPTRGVFTERRGIRHLQEDRTIGTYYIGSGTYGATAEPSNSRGEVPVSSTVASAAVTRAASLVQTDMTSTVLLPTMYDPGTGIVVSGPTWTPPTPWSGTVSKDVGGGKIYTILDPLSTGVYSGARQVQSRNRAYYQTIRYLTVGLQNHDAPFDDINDADGYDHNRQLRIFNASTGTTSYNTANVDSDNIVYNAGVGYLTGAPTFTNTDVWYMYGGTAGNRTQLRRAFRGTQLWGPYVYSSTVAQTTSVGSATDVWHNGTLRVNKNGTVVSVTSNTSDNRTLLSQIMGITVTAIRSGTPGSWSPATPAAPSNASCPLPTGTPAAPAVPDFVNSGNGRTFSLTRTNTTIRFDLNSFVTTTGGWLSTAVAQYLPTRGSTWPATWTSPTDWPQTNAFRPDVANGHAAVAYSTAIVDPAGGAGAQLANGYEMTDDVDVPAGADSLYLRIERNAANVLSFSWSTDNVTWTSASEGLDISGWGDALLLGPAIQSGDVNVATSATFTDMRIETTLASPNDVIDATDWDTTATGEDIMGRYLASQYQVWLGNTEITEDFFTWKEPTTQRRNASEDWIYNTREFWSQSRWWDQRDAGGNLVEKDAVTNAAENFTKTALRQAFAKTTLLTLDMETVQSYLRNRLASEAVADRVAGLMDTSNISGDFTLRERFNGLIYAVRTNRYPWNPNLNLWYKDNVLTERDPITGTPTGAYKADTNGINPWSPHWNNKLPNSRVDMGDALTPEQGNYHSLADPTATWLMGTPGHLLQPYDAATIKEDLPLKPQQFHHGVRIVNAGSIDWGFAGSRSNIGTRSIGSTTATDWRWSSNPRLGVSKLSIVTPNALYLQGNINVDQHETEQGGVTKPRFTPLAVMGDSVTLLSNEWKDTSAQIEGLTVENAAGVGSVTGSGTLATMMTLGPAASDTEYNVAIATNNLPTTRERVAEGQSAGFVDSMLLMENWNNRSMNYLGSLVVMDSRRYSTAFLLDSYKTYGQTPFGIIDNTIGTGWIPVFNGMQFFRKNWQGVPQLFRNGLYGTTVSINWAGQSPAILSEPTRVYEFNYDLLTEEGTPPFAPFGVSTAGIGGWVRIVK